MAFGDLVLDLDLERDIDTSDPRRRLGGGDGESDFGVRDLPLSIVLGVNCSTKGNKACNDSAQTH